MLEQQEKLLRAVVSEVAAESAAHSAETALQAQRTKVEPAETTASQMLLSAVESWAQPTGSVQQEQSERSDAV